MADFFNRIGQKQTVLQRGVVQKPVDHLGVDFCIS